MQVNQVYAGTDPQAAAAAVSAIAPGTPIEVVDGSGIPPHILQVIGVLGSLQGQKIGLMNGLMVAIQLEQIFASK